MTVTTSFFQNDTNRPKLVSPGFSPFPTCQNKILFCFHFCLWLGWRGPEFSGDNILIDHVKKSHPSRDLSGSPRTRDHQSGLEIIGDQKTHWPWPFSDSKKKTNNKEMKMMEKLVCVNGIAEER